MLDWFWVEYLTPVILSRPEHLFTRRTLVLATLLVWLFGFYAFRSEVSSLQGSGFFHFPFWDDWDTPLSFLQSLETAKPGEIFKELFDQHNESRKVTTKLLTVVIDRFAVFHSDLTINISYFVRAITVLIVCLPLLTRSLSGPLDWSARLSVIAFSTKLYAVGPANLYNGLWYVQTSFFLGILFAFGCLSALTVALSLKGAALSKEKTFQQSLSIAAGLMGLLSIFSFSGNVLLLPCSIITIWLMVPSTSLRSLRQVVRSSPSLVVLSCLVLATIVFFLGYQSPAHHASLRANFIDPRYIIAFLSNFYKYQPSVLFVLMNAVTGVALVAMAMAVIWRATRAGGKTPSWEFVHCISLVCFLFGLGAASSVGRGGTPIGFRAALADRYNSLSILFASIVCVCIVLTLGTMLRGRVMRAGSAANPVRKSLQSTVIASVVLLLVFEMNGLSANAAWRPYIIEQFSGRQQAVNCMKKYVRAQPDLVDSELSSLNRSCAAALYPNPDHIASRFKGSWCRTPVGLPSRTIRELCNDLRG